MGLDLVGLVMEIEDAFDIQFSDTDAQQMLTVGNVYEYILAHTPTTGTICLSAATFYRLRRGAHELGIKQRVRPNDPAVALLPARQRQRYWQALGQTTGLRLPRLVRPSWLVLLCVLAVLLSAVLIGFLVYDQTDSQAAALFVGFATAALLAWGAAGLTRGWAIHPAVHHRSLRALAQAALANNLPVLAAEYQGVHRQDIWLALQAIVVEQLGVPAEKVTPDASFVNDLGAG